MRSRLENLYLHINFSEMYTEFHLKASELNEEFLLKLKALFKGDERISITVEEEPDETEYLLRSEANKKTLEEHRLIYLIKAEELSEYLGRRYNHQ